MYENKNWENQTIQTKEVFNSVNIYIYKQEHIYSKTSIYSDIPIFAYMNITPTYIYIYIYILTSPDDRTRRI